ncbi:camphor resistance protein CrcB [Oligella ureolytica]|uniref:Fluoride-specific ion channel FluC n=1 Tax=Oligella ureolytica TaxID=90244 RepID=A0A378X980_9BURK|nr:fluoride efflux transporter CrcB [Oligella ureolytica]QPT40042.1 fluoride efflux transporter CrcB [Oligella ureolytica]SUA50037.1 camphor resistance protein CrcB [Oligella ureolytica]SUA51716.1 camphor resistance protein CrcB [Oligella ureolytica]
MSFLLVFLGGGLGSVARYSVSIMTTKLFGIQFLLGTLLVNVLGSFLMGLAVEYWALKSGLSEQTKLFLTTGFFGGFTTFSAFSLELVLLWSKGEFLQATLYVIASVLLSVAALFVGMALIR